MKGLANQLLGIAGLAVALPIIIVGGIVGLALRITYLTKEKP